MKRGLNRRTYGFTSLLKGGPKVEFIRSSADALLSAFRRHCERSRLSMVADGPASALPFWLTSAADGAQAHPLIGFAMNQDIAAEPAIVRIGRGVDIWNRGDTKALINLFRDDAVLSAHDAIDGKPGWIQGPREIAHYLQQFKVKFPRLTTIDILCDTKFFMILLSDGTRNIGLMIEPDEVDGSIRRMIVCRSVMQKKSNRTTATAAAG